MRIERQGHLLGLSQFRGTTVEIYMQTKSARLVHVGQVSKLTKSVVLVQPNEPGSILLGIPTP